ncbi:MAG: primosomal protein N' [Candidatus Cryptobacteroides sp.]
MSQVRFIKVIVPLRLEWEPLYSYEYDDNAPFPLDEGTRVVVPVGSKTYVAVVSCTDAGEEAKAVGLSRVKPVAGLAAGLAPVTPQEIALWRKVASYYLCTVGEVYKAAYPGMKVSQEETSARVRAAREARLAKERARIEAKLENLRQRLSAKEEALARARKESVKERLKGEMDVILGQIGALETDLEAPAGASAVPSGIRSSESAGIPSSSAALPQLSEAQMKVFEEIRNLTGGGKPVLLHGVTGSGKTEIYLKLAAECLVSGRSVLFLVPEIAMSRQLEERARSIFGDRLLVFHSAESILSRHETAEAMKQGPCLVLGTRSAIFLPFRNLGLVVVDEEHDTSYKQESPSPRYNARETAVMLGGIHGAAVLLGSATPSLESLYNCSAGRYAYVSLNERYFGSASSDVEVIDTIAERRKNGMIGLFSRKLIERIRDCLDRKRQVLILRERRSFSPAVQCAECGEIVKCRRCNVPLSLHFRQDGTGRLICHYCGRTYEYSGACPGCGGALSPLGAGTQKVEEEAAALFPEARIARLDGDSARDRKYATDVIRGFSKGEIDILIGTQIVAKGFDFSGLDLVAVIGADSILGQEDYRADEKGLQLLEQFRGRCGRRSGKGMFVIQTSQPGHPVYRTLEGTMESKSMMDSLLGERKLFGYPPYSRVVGIILKDSNALRADRMAADLVAALRQSGITSATSLVGPYSPAVDKVSGQNIRCARVLLPKDRNLAANKALILRTVNTFEKARKYAGHISLDVDPV